MRIAVTMYLIAVLTSAAGSVERTVGKPPSWPPAIPVGNGAYIQWELWTLQLIGTRAYMPSAHESHGPKRTENASHFLHEENPRLNGARHVVEAGGLYVTRANHWHGSPWH